MRPAVSLCHWLQGMHHDVAFTGSGGVDLEVMLMPGAVSAGQMIEREKAGLDEGILSLCLPHSRLYGESL